MAMTMWPRVVWSARQLITSVGLPGWLALASVSLCAVGLWGVIEPMRSEARKLDEESAVLERRWAEASREGVRAPDTPRQQLVAFKQRFPDDKGIAPALRVLHDAAQRQRLAMDQAEFKFVSEATEPLARYSIILPIRADYRSLRRFTRDVLRDLPAMALEEVNLSRGDPQARTLEARLRFVLFVSKPTTASPAPAAAQSN